MIIYEKSEKKIEIPNGLGTEVTINVINDCPEPEAITITENGGYEGLYDRVEVNVEQGGGEEVKLQNEKIVRPSSTDELIFNNLLIIKPDEGYNGMKQAVAELEDVLNAENQRCKVQGENEIKSLMTTLNVEKNGTYRANSFNVMDIDNDDAFEMDVSRSENSYYEIKFKINRNGSRIEGALLTVYKCDSEDWNGIFLDSDSQISFKWYDKYGTASIDPNGWNIIRFSPNNPDTSKRVWVNGRSVEVNEGATDNMDCTFGNMCIGGRNPYGLTTGAFDLAYVHYFMNYQYGWEEGHTPFYFLPEANNQISRCTYNGDGIAWLERDGEVGYNEVNVNVKTYPTFLEDAINRMINKAMQGMDILGSKLQGKSSSGMMFMPPNTDSPLITTLKNTYIDGDMLEHTDTMATFMVGRISSPSNNLIKPFVYTEGNSLSNFKLIAPYWYGGFSCTNVDVIENIFEGAEELEYMEGLYNLGTSFTTSRILDLSGSNLNDEALRKIGESLYDFTTPNQNGVSNGYVKFNSNVTEEIKNLYAAKNWGLWA